MEFAKVFWNVMTAVGCIFSLFAVIMGGASIFVMFGEMIEDLKRWRNKQKRSHQSLICDDCGQSDVFICDHCGHVNDIREAQHVK